MTSFDYRIRDLESYAGDGDVVGPGSSTDNAVARFDGTTGKFIQNSGFIVDDSARATGGNLNVTNSTVPATGVYRPATNVLGLSANTHSHVRVYDVDANGDAFVGLSGGGNDGVKGRVRVLADSDTWSSVTLRLEAKGPVGQVHLYQNGYVQFNVGETASGGEVYTSYINAAGGKSATSTDASLSVQGTGGLTTYLSGTGSFNWYTDNLSCQVFKITRVASAVNYSNFNPSATGNPVQWTAAGSNTNISMNIVPKGTGGLGVGFSGAVTGAFHVKQATGGTAIATFRDDGNTADLTIKTTASNEVQILTGSGDNLTLATNGGNCIRMDLNKNVSFNDTALATNATNGFMWIPSCPGTPTGVLTAPYSNAAAIIYDSSANKIWVNCGGTWRSTAALT